MVLTFTEEKLIDTIRKYVPKGYDLEIRGGRNGEFKILLVKKNVIKC